MNNKSLVNIVGILLIYSVFAAILFMWLDASAFSAVDNETTFMNAFLPNAEVVLEVSFTCIMLWFAIAEWFISAFAPPLTWYLAWAVLLLVTIGISIYESFLGPRGSSTDLVNYSVAGYYLMFGILPYYLASMLFSPTNAKYLIWPKKHLRRW